MNQEALKNFRKLVMERMSYWDKILMEQPEDVPITLRNEFALILTTLQVDLPSIQKIRTSTENKLGSS